MPQDWYRIDNIRDLDSPSLTVFPDRVAENIKRLKAMVPDTQRLRPHVKTHKSGEVSKMLLEAGISKFKCATIAEAEMLAEAGAPDVLLAYQPVGPKIERLAALVRAFPKTQFSCLADNKESLEDINTFFEEQGLQIPVLVDLNVGMNRTGIQPGEQAESLYLLGTKMHGVSMVGLHVYDGHLRDPDIKVRAEKCNASFAPVLEMKQHLIDKGVQKVIIVAGGSPTFPIHATRSDVECSPGTFIYWDKGYGDGLPEQPFLHAAVIVTRVISKPAEDIVCIDLGHKSIASENPLEKRIFFLNETDLTPIGHSEEHMVLKTRPNQLAVGDVLYGIPFHICPTVALYDSVTVIREHMATEKWSTLARNRKIHV